jgi:hypothetical protein
MTKQLTPAQIKELRVFLADYGLNVTPKKASKQDERQPWPIGPRVPGKPEIKSKWYRPQTLAAISKPYGKSMRLTGTN